MYHLCIYTPRCAPECQVARFGVGMDIKSDEKRTKDGNVKRIARPRENPQKANCMGIVLFRSYNFESCRSHFLLSRGRILSNLLPICRLECAAVNGLSARLEQSENKSGPSFYAGFRFKVPASTWAARMHPEGRCLGILASEFVQL